MKPNSLGDGFGSSRDFLNGWKEIASYLRRGVRTAQRYEREFGLPVRRPAGELKGVVATKSDIDAWLKKNPILQDLEVQSSTVPDCAFVKVPIQGRIKEMRTLLDQTEARKLELSIALARLNSTIQATGEVFMRRPQPAIAARERAK